MRDVNRNMSEEDFVRSMDENTMSLEEIVHPADEIYISSAKETKYAIFVR